MFFFYRQSICEIGRPITAIFCTMVGSKLDFIAQVQKFEEIFPQKILGAKTCKIWGDFGWLRTSTANRLSLEKMKIWSRTTIWSTAIPPAFGEKSRVNFVPVTSDIWRPNYTHSNRLSEGHILVHKWCCALKFLHVLENDQVLLANPLPGTGVSQQIFAKMSKNWYEI